MTGSFDRAQEQALRSLLAAAASAGTDDARLFGALIAARACRNELSLLGLSPGQFAGLLARQFPHLASVVNDTFMPTVALALLPANHAAFVATLHTRLMGDANPAVACGDADCLASIIAHACLRPDHLWRDLGLDGRDAVSAMLDRYFPALAARNVTHLRWKKFLAQEVAASLGVAPGPAPGCPGCEDFGFCFPHAR
ncbi:MAG: nitrogen fixation protein NifQ [Burkholderia sp.]|jgi:nitrogen fixation protein NifQ|uniref:nitrogen fixation protein NifQ n=1 Tax=Burkholderia sp. TaxID=36773 RepID=UPI0028285A83|nr:nitrogen fixation protein NifQ [Burkholderia sp.]MDR0241939.1 nitrogen fixation protein NifQ [Burkholderia sp.]